MQVFAINGKMKKIGAALIFFILCAAYTVSADQQYVLTVGETIVIPCLLEVWSDQSVNCVISNPEVLMSDGSGRAVIALSEGVSDVYVHMTNPDTDIRYSFVVVPAQGWDAAEGLTQPDETAIDGETQAGSGAGAGGADLPNVRVDTGGEQGNAGGSGVQDSQLPDSSADEPRTEAHMPEDDPAASPAETHMQADGTYDSETEARMPEDDPAASRTEARMSEDAHSTGETVESVPFWEDRGSGGISFEVIEDDFSGGTEAERIIVDSHNVRYRPIAYLNADGEVVPLFVCAAGREVRWKYIGRIIYIEDSQSYSDPYRVSACDCRGNIYYFSF